MDLSRSGCGPRAVCAAGADDADALWLTAVARVAFGTERFVRRAGLLRPATFEQYVEACVGTAVAVQNIRLHCCRSSSVGVNLRATCSTMLLHECRV